MLESLKSLNSQLNILPASDSKFKEYGQLVRDVDKAAILDALEQTEMPEEGNIYVASDNRFRKIPVIQQLRYEIFGGLPIEVGYCNGHSYKLNCLEWHHSPEINIANEDIVLFLGQESKLESDGSYSVKDVQPFFIPKGEMIALYGTTMHFAPCRTVSRGFKCLVILLDGINGDLKESEGFKKPKTLFKYGKWLITHPENERFVSQGAYVGIKGENLSIQI